jgi:hypothetical protein
VLGQLALEDIGVVVAVGAGRIGTRQVEQLAQLDDEQLQIGGLVAAVTLAPAPARDETLDGLIDYD